MSARPRSSSSRRQADRARGPGRGPVYNGQLYAPDGAEEDELAILKHFFELNPPDDDSYPAHGSGEEKEASISKMLAKRRRKAGEDTDWRDAMYRQLAQRYDTEDPRTLYRADVQQQVGSIAARRRRNSQPRPPPPSRKARPPPQPQAQPQAHPSLTPPPPRPPPPTAPQPMLPSSDETSGSDDEDDEMGSDDERRLDKAMEFATDGKWRDLRRHILHDCDDRMRTKYLNESRHANSNKLKRGESSPCTTILRTLAQSGDPDAKMALSSLVFAGCDFKAHTHIPSADRTMTSILHQLRTSEVRVEIASNVRRVTSIHPPDGLHPPAGCLIMDLKQRLLSFEDEDGNPQSWHLGDRPHNCDDPERRLAYWEGQDYGECELELRVWNASPRQLIPLTIKFDDESQRTETVKWMDQIQLHTAIRWEVLLSPPNVSNDPLVQWYKSDSMDLEVMDASYVRCNWQRIGVDPDPACRHWLGQVSISGTFLWSDLMAPCIAVRQLQTQLADGGDDSPVWLKIKDPPAHAIERLTRDLDETEARVKQIQLENDGTEFSSKSRAIRFLEEHMAIHDETYLQEKLEKAFQEGGDSVHFQRGPHVYCINLHTMTQQNESHPDHTERPVRRVGHFGLRESVLDKSQRYTKHRLSNHTPFRLVLRLYKLQKPAKWGGPPPARSRAGQDIVWSTTSEARWVIQYDLLGPEDSDPPKATLTFRFGSENVEMAKVDIPSPSGDGPDDSDPVPFISRFCQRPLCRLCRCICSESLEDLRLAEPRAQSTRLNLLWRGNSEGEFQYEWNLVEGELYTESRARNVRQSSHLCTASAPQFCELIGRGSQFIGLSWHAVTKVAHKVDKPVLDHARKLLEMSGNCIYEELIQVPVDMPVRRGEDVIVLDDKAKDFTKVQLYKRDTKPEGYIPACALADDRVEHTWEIRITEYERGSTNSRKRTQVQCKRSDMSCDGQCLGEDGLFDLNCKEPDALCAEVRRTTKGNGWFTVIRGLEPGRKYSFSIRPLIATSWDDDVTKESDYMVTCNDSRPRPWLHLPANDTQQELPPTQSFDKQTLDMSIWRGRSSHQKSEGRGWQARWVRIRPKIDWQGMDVFWMVRRRDTTQWTVKVLRESLGPSVAVPQNDCSPDSVPIDEYLCGRIRAGQNEMARLVCQPLGKPMGAATLDYAWLTQKSDDRVESSQPTGRFVRLEVENRALEIAEVSIFDCHGSRVEVDDAAVGSVCSEQFGNDDNFISFSASCAIDKNLGTACRTQPKGLQWLRLDMGRATQVSCIEIVVRFVIVDPHLKDSTQMFLTRQDCMAGATVSVTNDIGGTDSVWSKTEDRGGRWIYRYTFEPEDSGFDLTSTTSARCESLQSIRLESLKLPSFPLEHAKTILTHAKKWKNGGKLKWIDIARHGMPMPFDPNRTAGQCQVVRKFPSKAEPYHLRFREAPTSKPEDVVLKEGDDLRQDQAVLAMLGYFNRLWKAEGANLVIDGAAKHVAVDPRRAVEHPVEHPIYRAAPAGTNLGFLEMLKSATPVDDIKESENIGDNGWRYTPNLVSSAVATFVSAYALEIRDRHQGNMVLTSDNSLGNIDFGWFGEQPGNDTGSFPIPEGLRILFYHMDGWSTFCDLCWDAMQVLLRHMSDIKEYWTHVLRETDQLGFARYHRIINDDMPHRLGKLSRRDLDQELVGTFAGSLATFAKNKQHKIGLSIKSMSPNPHPEEPELEGDEPDDAALAAATMEREAAKNEKLQKELEEVRAKLNDSIKEIAQERDMVASLTAEINEQKAQLSASATEMRALEEKVKLIEKERHPIQAAKINKYRKKLKNPDLAREKQQEYQRKLKYYETWWT